MVGMHSVLNWVDLLWTTYRLYIDVTYIYKTKRHTILHYILLSDICVHFTAFRWGLMMCDDVLVTHVFACLLSGGSDSHFCEFLPLTVCTAVHSLLLCLKCVVEFFLKQFKWQTHRLITPLNHTHIQMTPLNSHTRIHF